MRSRIGWFFFALPFLKFIDSVAYRLVPPRFWWNRYGTILSWVLTILIVIGGFWLLNRAIFRRLDFVKLHVIWKGVIAVIWGLGCFFFVPALGILHLALGTARSQVPECQTVALKKITSCGDFGIGFMIGTVGTLMEAEGEPNREICQALQAPHPFLERLTTPSCDPNQLDVWRSVSCDNMGLKRPDTACFLCARNPKPSSDNEDGPRRFLLAFSKDCSWGTYRTTFRWPLAYAAHLSRAFGFSRAPLDPKSREDLQVAIHTINQISVRCSDIVSISKIDMIGTWDRRGFQVHLHGEGSDLVPSVGPPDPKETELKRLILLRDALSACKGDPEKVIHAQNLEFVNLQWITSVDNVGID